MSNLDRDPRFPPHAYLSSASSFLDLFDDLKWRAAHLRDSLAKVDSPLARDAIHLVDVLNMMSDHPTASVDEM